MIQDTRPVEEYSVSKIEGAVRVDPDNLSESLNHVDELIAGVPPDQPIVCYCSVGYRSSLVADNLSKRWETSEYRLENWEREREFWPETVDVALAPYPA